MRDGDVWGTEVRGEGIDEVKDEGRVEEDGREEVGRTEGWHVVWL